MNNDYQEFLKKKKIKNNEYGFKVDKKNISSHLFDFQKDLIKWSVKLGHASIFSGTGTGKTHLEIEFAKQIIDSGITCLIVSPLAVSIQTINIARDYFNIHISNLRYNEKIDKICIINYEQLLNIDASKFDCIILDESSILKSYSGKTRNFIIDLFKNYKYKLAATATPSPNDYMELGNHSEFMNVLSRTEMLSTYFIHDSGDTQKWRLKGHADNKFWEFIASWAAVFTNPADLDYDETGFKLPPLNIEEIIIKANKIQDGYLFQTDANTLQERRNARRLSLNERTEMASAIVNNSNDIHLCWCDLNSESEMLKKNIKDSVEVKGSDSIEHKEKSMIDFAEGKIKCLISKPSICGFGMNFQKCNNQLFVGLSDSFEQYYQAVRRSWRFGQKKPVNVKIIISDLEGAVLKNIHRKEYDAGIMIENMIKYTKKSVIENIKKNYSYRTYNSHDKKMLLPKFMEA
jgi:superfamily II DNA or RNA helicase